MGGGGGGGGGGDTVRGAREDDAKRTGGPVPKSEPSATDGRCAADGPSKLEWFNPTANSGLWMEGTESVSVRRLPDGEGGMTERSRWAERKERKTTRQETLTISERERDKWEGAKEIRKGKKLRRETERGRKGEKRNEK